MTVSRGEDEAVKQVTFDGMVSESLPLDCTNL